MNVTTVLIPLILGLTAWVLAIAGIFSRKRSLLCCLSWCACAFALWFPIYTIHRWVEINDVAAILDCAKADTIAADILLTVTAILNLVAFLVNREKKA